MREKERQSHRERYRERNIGAHRGIITIANQTHTQTHMVAVSIGSGHRVSCTRHISITLHYAFLLVT